jgi:A/G-specific adenine glycosylase
MSNGLPDSSWKQSFRRRLLAWYGRTARALPWRQTRDPYAIWVSEIMLQQTQVATVVPYYERFIATFPTIHALARAREAEVLRLWEGLGYYRRARQLHAAAQVLDAEHAGRFPRERHAVESLPGIGKYTAGAVLSIAFDAREPILEANTLRLLSRLLAYEGDPRQSQGQQLLWRFAAALLPRKEVGTFNQALMELGGEVCKPNEPACEICPVRNLCPTRHNGLQHRIPAPSKKPRYESVREAALVIWREGRVLLRRCRSNERWAGMWDFPRFPLRHRRGDILCRELTDKTASLTGLAVRPGVKLATLKYGVTRFRITLDCYAASCLDEGPLQRDVHWYTLAELEELPLSVSGRKISQLVHTQQATSIAGRQKGPSPA